MKKIIAVAVAALTVLTSSAGAEIPVPTTEVRNIVCEATKGLTFPTARDVMAVMWVESRYNPQARNGKSKGLMQVNGGSYNPWVNIGQGVNMLQDLYKVLGNPRSSFLAYNSGLGGFQKGKSNPNYFDKVNKAKKELPSEVC